jgi:hypothetical protein
VYRWACPAMIMCMWHLSTVAQPLPEQSTEWVQTAASDAYKVFPTTWLLMGKNYRKAWRTPVTLPVFLLSKSGLTVERLGGSRETNSLYLRDRQQSLWVLRSVDKNVRRGIPAPFGNTPFYWYKNNLTSANFPFAAGIAAILCRAAGIVAADPVYVFVEDGKALGAHRSLFAGTVCMLERRDPIPDNAPTEATDTVLQKIKEGRGHPVLKHQVLRARLLDMLMGDWDRHEGQWRWGILDSGGRQYYYAIPRDRDHALFAAGGVIPWLMKGSFEPYFTGFTKRCTNLKKLNRKAWDFDSYFLEGLTQADWEAAVHWIQSAISNEVIDDAIRHIPDEAQAVSGAFIRSRLISRRESLLKGAMDYFHFLQTRRLQN